MVSPRGGTISMKKWLFLLFIGITVVLLTSCAPDSVLILGGESDKGQLGQQETGDIT